jgi:hypothetical protein
MSAITQNLLVSLLGTLHLGTSQIVRVRHSLRIDQADINFAGPTIEPRGGNHPIRRRIYGPMVRDHDCRRYKHGSCENRDALPHGHKYAPRVVRFLGISAATI